MPRLFAAVPVADPAAVERLLLAQRLLAPLSRVKWVVAHQLHFTLKFLGEVPEPRVGAARRALDSGAAGSSSFRLDLEGLGAFPRPAAARVLWAGCGAGSDALLALAARVEAAYVVAGFTAAERPFSAHLTLGRVREGAGGRDLPATLVREAGLVFGTVEVREVILYQSVLGPSGPAHTPLHRVKLG